MDKKRVAVIGAGVSGLVAARHLKTHFDLTVFEKTTEIGGIWVYNETGENAQGSALYKNLRTNLPKEIMEFEDFRYEIKNESYVHHTTVLEYLRKYADFHGLKRYIKFDTVIFNVKRVEDQWEVSYEGGTDCFDCVFVCSGRYVDPHIPQYEGINEFEGNVLHSQKYRDPEKFKGETVLIIGIGPSGQDISYDLSDWAEKVYLSNHCPQSENNVYPKNTILKPDVARFEKNKVLFVDGSSERIDTIIFCTGYNYVFNFLDKSCGIQVERNYVHPLYLQLVSIPHPTMFFIGLPTRTFVNPMFEQQVKCCISILNGSAKIPSKGEMHERTRTWENHLRNSGVPQHKFHIFSQFYSLATYLEQITELGNIKPLPEVLLLIHKENAERRSKRLDDYRNQVVTIVDSKKFVIK